MLILQQVLTTRLMQKSVFIIGFIFFFGNINAQDFRYVKLVFDTVEKTAEVVYGNAEFLDFPYSDEASTTSKELFMDIYQPKGDKLNNRPAIIFAHGGGFLAGKRDVDDMEAFCDSFARKGYVTATIDYRLGVEVLDNADMHYTRAAFRGVQDGRAAIRFLRANAANYGIDADKVYWGGNSAGAFIGLNSVYMDDDEISYHTGALNYTIMSKDYIAPDLGGLDIGDNLKYSGKPDAVMSCWGGVSDTLYIDGDENTTVLLVHGTDDSIVPFNSGGPFSLNSVSDVFGSNAINTMLINLGLPGEETYFVEGEGHGFYGALNGRWINLKGGNEYWDTVVRRATDFYYHQHRPEADFEYTTQGLSIGLEDLSTDAISWLWDFGDGNTSLSSNPTHVYDAEGTYKVKLYIENSIQSWDTISQEVVVGTTGGVERGDPLAIVAYPNPTKGMFYLSHKETIQPISINLYTLTGQLILTKTGFNGKQIELDLSSLRESMYLLKVDSGTKTTWIKVVRE